MRRIAAAFLVLLSPGVILGGAYAGEQLGGGETGAEEIAAVREWTVRVNAYCRAQSEAIGALARPKTRAQRTAYTRRVKAISRRYERLANALPVPLRLEADVARLARLRPAKARAQLIRLGLDDCA